MFRPIAICLLFLTAALPALAEEIVLKDGTKIVGRMTGITSEKIEVETSYGKVQLNRGDIVTISFADNASAKAPDVAPAKQPLPKMDETLVGTQYINRTGKFSLTLPPDWLIDPNLRNSPTTLVALSSKDKMRFAMVIQEDYPGSMDSYRELTMLGARKTLSNFEELARTEAKIDGKPSILVYYRGTLQKSNNLPVEFLSAFIQSGNTFTKVTVWCVEPLFHDMQPAFEKLVSSYRTSGHITAAADSAKP
ncbi:MAG TPA: PsbP-related protein [Candidatus Acidoferrum sp.]|nr:PsbP-related protein [Candidatus Acidoferrum sp.]